MKVLLLNNGKLVAYNEKTVKIERCGEQSILITDEGQNIFISEIDSVLDDNAKRIPIKDAIFANYFYTGKTKKLWWQFWRK